MRAHYRGLICIASIATAALLGLAASQSAAAATVSPPITNPLNDDAISSILQEIDQLPTVPDEWINPATGDPYTAADIGEGLSAAEEAAGTLPVLSSLGTLTLGSAAVSSTRPRGLRRCTFTET